MTNLLWFSLLPFAWAFIFCDARRRIAVKGSYERYRFTGWAWAMLWLAYVWLGVVVFDAFAHYSVGSIVTLVLNSPYIVYAHHRLRSDDDDNPWRTLKGKIKAKLKAGVKRLREVRLPTAAAPIPSGA